MITLDRVVRRFRTDTVETTALDEISLTIARGTFVAIVGPSGCGKSTLLSVLGTIDKPDAGAYFFDGRDLTTLNQTQLADHRASHIGFIFQSFNLIDNLTIRQNVALGIRYRKNLPGDRKILVEQAMERVGIAHRADHYPQQLSGGQQQRAAIARAIAGSPDMLLADEPTGNLDTENGAHIMTLLENLHADGTTIIMVTHAPTQADRAQQIVSMLDGRIVQSKFTSPKMTHDILSA